MASPPSQPGDLDSPWKEALEHFLGPFLGLFLPAIHEGIDWRRGYESLDKELQQVVQDARIGRRLADKLFKVWRKDGDEVWLLIHVEVQGRRERRLRRAHVCLSLPHFRPLPPDGGQCGRPCQ